MINRQALRVWSRVAGGENNPDARTRVGRLEEATAAYACAHGQLSHEAALAFGNQFLQLGRPGKAMAVFEQAMGADAHLQAVCRNPQDALTQEARCEIQLANSRHILARYPNFAPAHYAMACALLNMGEVAQARRASERALVIDATVPTYYHVLIHTGTAQQNANALSALEQLAQHEEALDAPDRATLHFLLAKAYDDGGEAARAFAHLEKANVIKRALVAYDEAATLGRMGKIARSFTAQRMAALQGAGTDSPLPVFVIGMPRSGTTLVEQILASHPDVYGAGELDTLPDLIAQETGGAFADAWDGAMLRRLGEAYVRHVAKLAPDAGRIIDKMPYNFLYAGLIHLALPKARIVHVTRNALDTCFSCYQQTFAGDVGFAYAQDELGRYYKAYETLMAHWRAALPEGRMLDVRYEALVKDPQAAARRIVEYCDLPWDPRCLEFDKTQRAVVTASVYQVRQPVTDKAVGRAKLYDAYLGALRAALGLL